MSHRMQRAPGQKMTIPVSQEDLYNGITMEIQQKTKTLCSKCNGSGAYSEDDISICQTCKGRGVIIVVKQPRPGMIQQIQMQCNTCHGRKKITKRVCDLCNGNKIEKTMHTIDLTIERGMMDDNIITYDEQWDVIDDSTLPSELQFRISTVKHDTFIRDKNDLHTNINITLKEALLGFQRTIQGLDNHPIHVKRTSITKPGSIIRIPNEGMPIRDTPSEFGSLHVKVSVLFPKTLTDTQRQEFSRIFS